MEHTTPDVITPIIHLNGDAYHILATQIQDAYRAVRHAITALEAAAPNPRNYYPEAGRYEQAVAQHRTRLTALVAVRDSLMAEYAAIQDA